MTTIKNLDRHFDPPEENHCPECAIEEHRDRIPCDCGGEDKRCACSGSGWITDLDFDWSEFTRLCPMHLKEARDYARSERQDDDA